MKKEIADKIMIEYTKKIFGFALSKTFNIDKAEELASQINLEVYTALLRNDNIVKTNQYIYKICLNVYARFINELNQGINVSLDDVNVAEAIGYEDMLEKIIQDETYKDLRREITYLSNMQRKIVVLHYFEHLKQKEIADKLDLPLGTVKWHLYEAKHTLKEGLKMKRETGRLGINPIIFDDMGHSGYVRNGDTSDFFKKVLTQNIAYAAYHTPKTINEIAEELNVSPIFIADEVLYLEEHGFMNNIYNDKYQSNMYITESTKEIDEKLHELYNHHANIVCEKYIPLVFDAMQGWRSENIYVPDNDFNYMMWSTVLYAVGYKLCVPSSRSVDKYYIRKGGGEFIAGANITKNYKVSYNEEIYSYCGGMIRYSEKYPIWTWQTNTYYDNRKLSWNGNLYTDFEYLYEFFTGKIKKEETQIEKFIRLYDKGYIISDKEKDTVNIMAVVDRERFNSFLPTISDELKSLSENLDEEIYNLKKDMYPNHIQELCRAWNSSSLCSSGIQTRILEQLLTAGTLKPLTEIQKNGVATIMFSDILPK